MRCADCNVDIPEIYNKCPLCGSKSSDIAPLIPGIITAEYPKVKTQPKKINVFPVFILIWLLTSAFAFLLNNTGIISDTVFGLIFTLIPLLWTLIGRPLFVKQGFKGNYIVMNFYTLNLAAIVFGSIFGRNERYYMLALPTIVMALIVFLYIFTEITERNNVYKTAPYTVLFIVYCIVAGIISFIITRLNPIIWILPVLCCVFVLALAYHSNPQKTINELKAKFSIQ